MPEKRKVLAIGAAGHFAGLVLPELAKRGAYVRGFIQKDADREAVLQHGARETAVGDLRDPASVKAALQGMDALFYIAPAFIADEGAVGRQVVDAAVRAGVRRIVFSSVIHPTLGTLVNHREKGPVEEAIFESNLEYTILQPAMFFQNFAQGWAEVVKSGTYAEPWSAETRFTRVDYRDVAEVAAMALTEDRLLYGTFELCSEGNLNRHDVAALMGKVLGRNIRAGTVDLDKTGGGKDAPPPPIRTMMEWYNHHGLLGSSLTLCAILGREPRTLEAYFEELKATDA